MTSNSGESSSASRTVRVGLIGSGKMGVQHLKAIKATPGAVVVGVADPAADKDTLKPLLPADAQIFASAAELFTQVKPDVVHIVTPPTTHTRLALEALTAGCHVYIEKPFTPTRAEAAQIFALAAERGLKVCAGHQYLFEGPSLAVLDTLDAIGTVVHIESYFAFRTARRTITPVDQAKDILPHAVYPIVAQMRAGSGLAEAPIEMRGLDVRSSGDIYALLRLGDVTGLVLVTLSGRPVEQYQNIISTNGSYRADYITSSVTRLTGPGAGPSVLFTPYRRAFQTISGATRGFAKLIFGRKTSYPGLLTIFDRFYRSIANNTPPPLTPQSILDTVEICERIGLALDEAEQVSEEAARTRLEARTAALPPLLPGMRPVLVTGGTGLLGRPVVEELRHAGFPVRVLARRQPRYSARIPGVDYVVGDLARELDPSIMDGCGFVVHCAAETAGGVDDHKRNSIDATRNVFEAAARAGITQGIHVSSLAVIKPGHEVGGGPLDEQTPLDAGHMNRGPYVWGKAESELLVQQIARERGLEIKIIRPGPLVDYAAFQPPGRLGRELGPTYLAIGPKKSDLSVCDVGTAGRVIRSYVQDFAAAPPLVNMVEAPPPSRRALTERLLQQRPDLKVRWFPGWLLRLLSGPLKLMQRYAMGSAQPIDIYAAFASERYRTDVAASVIARAGASSIKPPVVSDVRRSA